MLKWSGKGKLSCNSKYSHNVLIFFQGPLKFRSADNSLDDKKEDGFAKILIIFCSETVV